MKAVISVCLLLASLSVQAGAIKELLIEHQEAVAFELFGHTDIDSVEFVSTDFTPATLAGATVALKSVVLVYSATTGDYENVTCVGQFKQVAPRSFTLIETVCN